MKISRWFTILAFVVAILAFVGLASSTALADTIPDPGFKLCCDGGSTTALFTPNDPNFTFTVVGQGGSVGSENNSLAAQFEFINATGEVANGLTLDINFAPEPDLIFTCEGEFAGGPYFTNCTVIPESPTRVLIEYGGLNTGEGGFGGIPAATNLSEGCTPETPTDCSTTTPGADFIVQVFDHGGDIINEPFGETLFTGRGFLVPEPSTVLLVLAGVALLFLFRRAGWVPKLT